MDIIKKAQEKRERLKAELAKIEDFLATASELVSDVDGEASRVISPKNDYKKSTYTRIYAKIRSEAEVGAGEQSANAVQEILREANRPISTRNLLPLVRGRGVDVGGKDPIATLSARLGNEVKKGNRNLVLYKGQWHLRSWIENELAETAELSWNETSAASDR